MKIRGLATASALLVPILLTVPAGTMASGAADVCLEFISGDMDEPATHRVQEAVSDAVAQREALFPDPTVEWATQVQPVDAEPQTVLLEIDAGHGTTRSETAVACLEPGLEWSARFGRAFLGAGADRMLDEAPTTPGIDSDVTIEWYPAEGRLRTHLSFAGPLDIPNGTCWVDDVLSIDQAGGVVAASAEQGLRTSLFAEGACRRFFEYLPDGGAGEQAVTLLPTQITLPEGDALVFVAELVRVDEDAVVVGGSLERR